MSRLVTLLTLLCAPLALAGKPTFQSVLAKFPPATLPLTLEAPGQQTLKLTTAEAAALGISKDNPVAGLPGKSLRPIARIQRKSYQVLLVASELDKTTQQTFLLTYGEKGTLLGGALFHRSVHSEKTAESNLSTLDQAGVVSRLIKEKHPLHDEGLPGEFVVTSEQRAKLTSTGALEVMAPAWSTRTGSYLDHATKEELRVFDKRVFYRPNVTTPFQELEGDGNTMRLKGAQTPYLLTWNDRRSAISAQNPSGAVQLFTREW